MAEQTTLFIDGIPARVVESPATAEEAAQVLARAAEAGCAVFPVGGGTQLDLGAPVARAEVALRLTRLDHIVDHQPANLTVTSEAGITLATLNDALGRHGQFLPLDAPFPAAATLGGILATNLCGPLRLRFGSPRDLLIGIQVALADGKLARGGGKVVKNVAGYDMPKLFVGSLGTLGVITEATFKVLPLPMDTETILATFSRLEAANSVALQLAHSPLLPLSAELLNTPAAAALGLAAGYTLAVRFGGNRKGRERQLGEVETWARAQGASATSRAGTDAALWAALRDFPFGRPTVVKISVLPSQLAETGAQVERLAAEAGLECAFRAHSLGVMFASLEGDAAALPSTVQALRAGVEGRHGYVVVQRASRELRAVVDVWGEPGSGFEMMRGLKQELDPQRILNPGRFIGGL